MKVLHVLLIAASLALASLNSFAEEIKAMTIAAVHQDKATLAGKQVSVQGKVIKVNNRIMGRNFVHVRDNSGETLIVTSNDTADVDDQVKASGRVVLDRDFGYGYKYALLLEDASINKVK